MIWLSLIPFLKAYNLRNVPFQREQIKELNLPIYKQLYLRKVSKNTKVSDQWQNFPQTMCSVVYGTTVWGWNIDKPVRGTQVALTKYQTCRPLREPVESKC